MKTTKVVSEFALARSREVDVQSVTVISALVASVLIAETLLFLRRPLIALSVYYLVVIASALLPLWASTDIAVFQSFVLVAVFRIVDLGFPSLFDDPLVRVMFVYLPISLSVIVTLSRSTTVDLQVTPKALLALPLFVVLGCGMALVEYAVLRPDSFISDASTVRLAFFVLFVGLYMATTEELLFRGLLQRAVGNVLGVWAGRVVSSVVFGMLHAVYFQLPEIGVAVVFGFLYALLYDVLEDITSVIVIHATVNILLFGFLPLYQDLLPTLFL